MMRLGIDFGTTRIVVAAVDRGNYPVVSFEDSEGAARDWFPPLVAARRDERLYGWDAWHAQTDPSYTVVRSIKRTFEDAGPATLVQLGGSTVPMLQLLEEMARSLKAAILDKSNVPGKRGEAIEIMLGVPANANSNQRFLTVDAFQRAGFQVLGLLNEPSAASVEYGHKNRDGQKAERVLVYDLGGGTFDVSLVEIDGLTHSVAATEGVQNLGGDDFDILLADMALLASGIDAGDLTQAETFRLYEECRDKKESLHPNTRRIVVDLGGVREGLEEVSISAADYYERCRPLVQQTLEITENLLGAYEPLKIDAVYVTGGGSELPLVSRMLREVFARRVKRSAYTRSATAIGLAIQGDAQAGYVLRENFGRHFGVWRETDEGRMVAVDVLFPKGTPLPGPGESPLGITRSYSPVHNVGHFRYLECSHFAQDGRPAGDIAVWDEILFPFDPMLRAVDDLSQVGVHPSGTSRGQLIQESYSCDAAGTVEVHIKNLSADYTRSYRLARWAGEAAPVIPGKKRSRAKGSS